MRWTKPFRVRAGFVVRCGVATIALLGFVLPLKQTYSQNTSSANIPADVLESLRENNLTLEEANKIAEQDKQKKLDQSSTKPSPVPRRKPPATRIETPVQAYDWPEDSIPIPLQADIRTEIRDGFPETFVYFTGLDTLFYSHISNGLVVANDPGDASASLVSRLMPSNKVEIYLFRPNTFLPNVSNYTMRGYQKGLAKKHGDDIQFADDKELLPEKTFKVYGHQWGRIQYELENESEESLSVIDYFVPLSQNLLVIRVEGIPSFVSGRRSAVETILSTLTIP